MSERAAESGRRDALRRAVRAPRRGTLAASVVVLVAAGAALASDARSTRLDSGVKGVVTIGPTCPVERYPPDPACADRPYDALIKATRGGHTIARTRSGADGRFTLRLAPGRYRLRASSPQAGPFPFTKDERVVRVRSHRFTRVHISFDSGIR